MHTPRRRAPPPDAAREPAPERGGSGGRRVAGGALEGRPGRHVQHGLGHHLRLLGAERRRLGGRQRVLHAHARARPPQPGPPGRAGALQPRAAGAQAAARRPEARHDTLSDAGHHAQGGLGRGAREALRGVLVGGQHDAEAVPLRQLVGLQAERRCRPVPDVPRAAGHLHLRGGRGEAGDQVPGARPAPERLLRVQRAGHRRHHPLHPGDRGLARGGRHPRPGQPQRRGQPGLHAAPAAREPQRRAPGGPGPPLPGVAPGAVQARALPAAAQPLPGPQAGGRVPEDIRPRGPQLAGAHRDEVQARPPALPRLRGRPAAPRAPLRRDPVGLPLHRPGLGRPALPGRDAHPGEVRDSCGLPGVAHRLLRGGALQIRHASRGVRRHAGERRRLRRGLAPRLREVPDGGGCRGASVGSQEGRGGRVPEARGLGGEDQPGGPRGGLQIAESQRLRVHRGGGLHVPAPAHRGARGAAPRALPDLALRALRQERGGLPADLHNARRGEVGHPHAPGLRGRREGAGISVRREGDKVHVLAAGPQLRRQGLLEGLPEAARVRQREPPQGPGCAEEDGGHEVRRHRRLLQEVPGPREEDQRLLLDAEGGQLRGGAEDLLARLLQQDSSQRGPEARLPLPLRGPREAGEQHPRPQRLGPAEGLRLELPHRQPGAPAEDPGGEVRRPGRGVHEDAQLLAEAGAGEGAEADRDRRAGARPLRGEPAELREEARQPGESCD
mmetsp:Transcript_75945/g.164344  ORF Transcript_75945/g.164344 Transcript_75945/m.164344 type:complete len:727 (-) Transcript_75945:367-2547(-)